jgi:hypothetical protein
MAAISIVSLLISLFFMFFTSQPFYPRLICTVYSVMSLFALKPATGLLMTPPPAASLIQAKVS